MPRVEPSVQPSNGASEFDRALDTLGAILRVYGECAFDTDRATASDVKESCSELWRELSLGVSKSSVLEGAERSQRRDYAKVHRFFENQRRQEQEFVVRGIGNLRQTVQEFALCLTAAVSEDRNADTQIDGQLTRLVDAVGRNDMDAIR